MEPKDPKRFDLGVQQAVSLSILHVGPMWSGSTAVQRADALKDLGNQLTVLNGESAIQFVSNPSLISRLERKILGPQDKFGTNAGILKAMQAKKFDVLWIDKGLTVQPKTLQKAHELQPSCRIVGYSPDDMMNPANQSRQFLRGLPLYDFFISTKSFNVAELEGLGCPKVLFIDNAYDPHTHRPLQLTAEERQRLGGPVGFIGQWEPARAESLRKLALAGIPVRVCGLTWERMRNAPPGLVLENRPLWGEDYARAICAFDINLCFLRKSNRDLQTQRTMEIPACDSFMLAERTAEHQRLFVEGQEAEFFGDDDELIRKVRHYLDHPEDRRRIARRGYERCLRDGYSNAERLRQVLKIIMASELHGNRAGSIQHGEVMPASVDVTPIKTEGLGVLYVGPMLNGSTTLQRAEALKDLGHQLTVLTMKTGMQFVSNPSLIYRIERKILGPQDNVGVNASILKALQAKKFDVLWIDKGLTVQPKTLQKAHELQPGCRIVGYSPDDMMNPANQSRQFLKGLPLYDFFITTKSFNVTELEGLGCRKVLFTDKSYDPHTHRPLPLTAEERRRWGGPVGFIGQWEPERAASLRKLALAGIPVRVWGFTWERMRGVPPGLLLENLPLWGEDYARAICAFDISLCFLRKSNRDQQTSRTMEIPACGCFMLGERTDEHQRLFVEGQEAEFFADDDELLRKVRYYLDHPEDRRRIARRGYERCLRDGYGNADRFRELLKIIMASELQRS